MKHTVITGHYGSGKSNMAINLALRHYEKAKKNFLIDADIVNPYFRSADSRTLLEKNGIELLAPLYANTNLDIPALPADIQKVFAADCKAVWDIGGDDSGAVVLGRYADAIKRDGYEMLYVLNFYRPLTDNTDDMTRLMYDIEQCSGLKCSGLINNSNIGAETSAEDILKTFSEAKAVSEKTGLPVVFTTVISSIDTSRFPENINILPVTIDTKRYF